MSVREIFNQSLKMYKEGVRKDLYSLDKTDIEVLAQGDFYRRIMMGEGGCSFNVQVEAGQKLMELRETPVYIKAEDKFFAGRV